MIRNNNTPKRVARDRSPARRATRHEFVALPVRDGGVTLVDPDIAEKLAGTRLYRHRDGYISLYHDRRMHYLHRLVCPAGAGLEVDHINARKRDNRRVNLRAVSHQRNIWAARRPRPSRSGYRGVYYDRRWRRYSIRIQWCGQNHSKRSYASALIAAFARDDAARKITGLEEGLNFPCSVARGQLRPFLEALGGRLFGVVFVRRTDGAVRRMTCRQGVALETNGKGLPFDPAQRNLYPVFDVGKRNYRFIPLENVLCLTCNRTRYRVS